MKSCLFESSSLLLLLSNAVTIAVAVFEHWRQDEVMWIYWGQSVVIGIFNFFRMWSLQQFTTDGLKMSGVSVSPTRAAQRQVSGFFALHYGFFHVAYLVFLGVEKSGLTRSDLIGVGVCVAVFAVNHGLSFRQTRALDRGRSPNLGTLMFLPYARIIPMHLMIVFGSFLARDSRVALILFLVLKTVADWIMHLVAHYEDRRPPGSAPGATPPAPD